MPFSVALLSSAPFVLKGQGERWNYAASLTPDVRLRGSVLECAAVRRFVARSVEPAPSSSPRTSGMTGGLVACSRNCRSGAQQSVALQDTGAR